MQRNILILLIVPAIVMGIVAYLIMTFGANGSIYSHDVFESHHAIMLLPFAGAGGFFLGYIPGFIYLSSLLFGEHPAMACNEEITPIAASQTPTLFVGQVIAAPASNCTLRVKTIKSIFADLQEDQFNHCLQFSY